MTAGTILGYRDGKRNAHRPESRFSHFSLLDRLRRSQFRSLSHKWHNLVLYHCHHPFYAHISVVVVVVVVGGE